MRSCTKIRLAQTHVCPELRNFDAIAPRTAASKSASSKTIKGALPPNSSETFFTVSAQAAIRRFPTAVEPVKESLRTRSEGGRHFARQHGDGEIPGGNRRNHPHRLFQHQQLAPRHRLWNDFAVGTLAFLCKPLHKACCIRHLSPTLGERLPLLKRDDPSQIFMMLFHGRKPSLEHRRTFLCKPGPPLGKGLNGCFFGDFSLSSAAIRHRNNRLQCRRIEHRKCLPAARSYSFAANQSTIENQVWTLQWQFQLPLRNCRHDLIIESGQAADEGDLVLPDCAQPLIGQSKGK